MYTAVGEEQWIHREEFAQETRSGSATRRVAMKIGVERSTSEPGKAKEVELPRRRI